MPILTYYLSPSDYGTLALFNSYVSLTIPFIGLTSTAILGLKYFQLEITTFKNLFFTVFLIQVIGIVLFCTGFFFLRNELSLILEIPAKWLMLIPIISFLVILGETLQTLLIMKKEVGLYSKIVLSKVLFEISISLTLVAFLGMGWSGRVSAWLIAALSFSLVAIYYFKKNEYLKGTFKLTWVKQSLVFGIPLIPHQIGKLIINQSDRIFISKMISLEATGLYSVGYLVGSLILIISMGAMNVYSPFLLERLSKINEYKKIEIIRFSYTIIFGLIMVFIVLNLLSPIIFNYILAKEYANSLQYVFWISLSYLFWGIYLVFTGYIIFLKKTAILSILSLISIALNLIGNYYFILYFGAIGAAYATALSFFILTILVIIIAQRIHPMPWFELNKLIKSKQ